MPFFKTAESQNYMPEFDGKRHLDCVESRDYGMAFMADLFRTNPDVLEAAIRIADTSMTIDMRTAATESHTSYDRTPDGEVRPFDMQSSALGQTFAACEGVRVLIHRFTTEKNQNVMSWHADDMDNGWKDGSYSVATILLPASELDSDAICTEVSGMSLAVPRGCGLWLPCNVMHRGVPTGAMPRHGLMVEFIAAGRRHNSALGKNHRDVKDWIFMTKNMLMEHRRLGPQSGAFMSYTNAPMPNPYIVTALS